MTTLRRRAALAVAVTLASLVALLGPAGATSADPPGPAAMADVRVTINNAGTRGRVVSERASCERRRTVVVPARGRLGADVFGPYVTDRQGSWSALTWRRGESPAVSAIAIGDGACEVAQSRVVRPLGPAAKPAQVRIALRLDGPGVRRGRVTSPRVGCERGTLVLLLSRDDRDGPWRYEAQRLTDDEGRYDFSIFRRPAGQTTSQLTTVALGTARCSVAQSDLVSVQPL